MSEKVTYEGHRGARIVAWYPRTRCPEAVMETAGEAQAWRVLQHLEEALTSVRLAWGMARFLSAKRPSDAAGEVREALEKTLAAKGYRPVAGDG